MNRLKTSNKYREKTLLKEDLLKEGLLLYSLKKEVFQ